jgi:pyridoxal phosphate enzyme (YggS family)
MPFLSENYQHIRKLLDEKHVSLVAVSKFKTPEEIRAAYEAGQYDFGENYVQELTEKYEVLPKDIRWHFIGHLQSNKVKYIAPFIYLIQSVDSEKLLQEINKQAEKAGRRIACLLQVHIAREETKYGFDESELDAMDADRYPHIEIKGLMGMATFTEDTEQIRSEFEKLRHLYEMFRIRFPQAHMLSMGMSGDYDIAIEQGSNMVRLGSLIFGDRTQPA